MATATVSSAAYALHRESNFSPNKTKKAHTPKSAGSHRRKLLKLPEITRPASTSSDEHNDTQSQHDADTRSHSEDVSNAKNPFRMPADIEVFKMRENERSVKEQAKERNQSMKVWEKGVKKRKNFKGLLREEEDDIVFYEQLKKRDADKILVNRHTRAADRHLGKENLQDFISKKREMFLVQYALGVKREEMRKLEEIAQGEEQKLLDDEKALEEDAAKFDAFLKENDKNSVEAIKKAEMETKAKLEKIQEIKKLNMHIMSIRSDMSKNEDQMRDLQRYRNFLDKLTPREWFEEQRRRRLAEKEQQAGDKRSEAGSESVSSAEKKDKRQDKARKGGKFGNKADQAKSSQETEKEPENEEKDDDDLLYDEEDEDDVNLFFQTPQQLLDLFGELEENNLALIQNCQETEETLEELKQKIHETEARMESETQSLKQQIDFLNAAIQRDEEKARMLEEKARLFSSGYSGAEDQEKLLDDLNHKVKEVYRRCLGDNDANLSTLQMLTNIENRLEQLFETIEMMPPDKVEQAEKLKDKERRQRLREEKMEAQRALQEERVQRALERARAPVKKKTGKPIMFRSAPIQKKKKKETETKQKENEDMAWYWQ